MGCLWAWLSLSLSLFFGGGGFINHSARWNIFAYSMKAWFKPLIFYEFNDSEKLFFLFFVFFFFPCFFNGFDLTKMAKLVSCFTQSCVLGFISITFKFYICCVLAVFCCRNYEDKGTKNHSLDFCLWEDGKIWPSIWYVSKYNSRSSIYMLFYMPLKCHLDFFLLLSLSLSIKNLYSRRLTCTVHLSVLDW